MYLLNRVELIIIKIEKTVMSISVIFMVVCVFLQVFFRYVLRISVPWTEELAIVAFIITLFYGAALAVYHEQHLGVNNVVNKLPLKGYIFFWYLKKITILLFIIIVLLIGSYSFVIEGLNQRYAITRLPLFYVFIQIPIFGFLSVFHIVMSLIKKDILKNYQRRKV